MNEYRYNRCQIARGSDEKFCWNCGAKTVKRLTITETPHHKLDLEKMQKGGKKKYYVELSEMTDTIAFLDINKGDQCRNVKHLLLWFTKDGKAVIRQAAREHDGTEVEF